VEEFGHEWWEVKHLLVVLFGDWNIVNIVIPGNNIVIPETSEISCPESIIRASGSPPSRG